MLTIFEHTARAVRAVIFILVAVMTCSLLLQVVMRYVFNHALSWSEEVALACFTWSMLLSIALAIRGQQHVRVELLTQRLPPVLKLALGGLVLMLIVGFGLFVAWHGWRYVMDSRSGTSAALAYPIVWLYAAAPMGGALMAWFGLEELLRLMTGESIPPQKGEPA